MPHVDIKFRRGVADPTALASLLQPVADTVGRFFDEDPDYVSVELVPQNEHSLNRKTIDIELHASPDSSGTRERNLSAVADALLALALDFMERNGVAGDASAFCRIFGRGTYSYGAPAAGD
jgi:hypothetical protein